MLNKAEFLEFFYKIFQSEVRAEGFDKNFGVFIIVINPFFSKN